MHLHRWSSLNDLLQEIYSVSIVKKRKKMRHLSALVLLLSFPHKIDLLIPRGGTLEAQEKSKEGPPKILKNSESLTLHFHIFNIITVFSILPKKTLHHKKCMNRNVACESCLLRSLAL